MQVAANGARELFWIKGNEEARGCSGGCLQTGASYAHGPGEWWEKCEGLYLTAPGQPWYYLMQLLPGILQSMQPVSAFESWDMDSDSLACLLTPATSLLYNYWGGGSVMEHIKIKNSKDRNSSHSRKVPLEWAGEAMSFYIFLINWVQ